MTDNEFEARVAFTPRQIDACFVNSLVNLVNACREVHVSINTVQAYQNGWLVTFENFDGDAVCHDGSYSNPIHNRYFETDKYHNDWSESGDWETIGFPWDYGDVSVHSAEELAAFLAALRDGINIWDEI